MKTFTKTNDLERIKKGLESMSNEFGEKIKKIRKSKGLTQQEFADSLGYAHKSTINKIESGQEDMSYQKIIILLKEYMLSARDLFDFPEEDMNRLDQLVKESKSPNHNSCLVYIHGLYGNKEEANFYTSYSNKYDVIGLNYKDGNPWEVKDQVIKEFTEISNKYKKIYVIANSIGAFYTYMYLSSFKIQLAFFISPLVINGNVSFDIDPVGIYIEYSVSRIFGKIFSPVGDDAPQLMSKAVAAVLVKEILSLFFCVLYDT